MEDVMIQLIFGVVVIFVAAMTQGIASFGFSLIALPLLYFLGGLITKEVVNYSIYLFPGLIIGTILGISMGNRVDELLFKRVTLGLITAMGVMSLISGI